MTHQLGNLVVGRVVLHEVLAGLVGLPTPGLEKMALMRAK